MCRWVCRYYNGRFVLLHDGKLVGESVDPINLIIASSYITQGGVDVEAL